MNRADTANKAAHSPGRRLTVALVAGTLLATGAVALGALRLLRRDRPPTGQTAGALGPFRVGEEVRSHAHVTVRLDMGRGAPPQRMDLDGQWRTSVTEADDQLATVAYQLVDLRASAAEGTDASARAVDAGAELARELGQPFFVRHRASGAVFEVWLPRGMKPAMANILLTLVGEAQLVRPAQPQPAWIVEERDVNGAYLAAYQEIAPGKYHKQKARYLDVADQAAPSGPPAPGAPPEKTTPEIRIDRSDIDLVTDVHGRLLELRADDTTTILLSGLAFNVSVHVTLDQAQQLSRSPSSAGADLGPEAFARAKAGLEPHPMAQLGLDPAAESARRDRVLLAGATKDVLLGELRAAPAAAAGQRPDSTLVARWEALFRLEPEAAAQAPTLVLNEPAERAKVLIDALSGAGTPEAQRALATLALAPTARPSLRLEAIQYLALQSAPVKEAVAALRTLLDQPNTGREPELARRALFAFGATAHNLRPTAPARAREVAAELEARLGRAKSLDAKQDLIVAIGNAGDPGSLPTLRAFVAEKASPLRTTAIEALRFIPDPSVDALLGELLGRGHDTSTRFTALAAIRFRDVGPFALQLADVVRHDPIEHVRRAAIDLLGSHLAHLPTLRPLLEEVAQKDPAPHNRELAATYIARLDKT